MGSEPNNCRTFVAQITCDCREDINGPFFGSRGQPTLIVVNTLKSRSSSVNNATNDDEENRRRGHSADDSFAKAIGDDWLKNQRMQRKRSKFAREGKVER
ncbi:hypothetical protein Q1695_011453 [Nippostrongylus brasiliensis]|nr:hypothetical protein Q1695_011453 [Nippostrongylus brasiliensis]